MGRGEDKDKNNDDIPSWGRLLGLAALLLFIYYVIFLLVFGDTYAEEKAKNLPYWWEQFDDEQ